MVCVESIFARMCTASSICFFLGACERSLCYTKSMSHGMMTSFVVIRRRRDYRGRHIVSVRFMYAHWAFQVQVLLGVPRPSPNGVSQRHVLVNPLGIASLHQLRRCPLRINIQSMVRVYRLMHADRALSSNSVLIFCCALAADDKEMDGQLKLVLDRECLQRST